MVEILYSKAPFDSNMKKKKKKTNFCEKIENKLRDVVCFLSHTHFL